MVEALLVSGIAGAGLVLTTLTLGVLKSNELLEQRSKALREAKSELKKTSKKPEGKTTRVLDLAKKIASLENLPDYYGLLIFLSFFFFGMSSLLATLWICTETTFRNQLDPWVGILFLVGVFCFIITGILMMADLQSLLKLRYEELKNKR